jgi:hypothetical protein
VYAISALNPHYDEPLFVSHFIKGLKSEIRGAVESQVPETLACAYLLAQVQQEVWEETKQHTNKPLYPTRTEQVAAKVEVARLAL